MDKNMGIALQLMLVFSAAYATTGKKGFAAAAILCFVILMRRVVIVGRVESRG